MTSTIARSALVALLLAAGGPGRAADVFSPGELARPHAALSGLENCTKCHPRGEQLSRQRCLDCHKELAPRIAAGAGLHGRLPEKERDCWTCHHEHQGRDFALVDWGPGGVRRFDHARAGAPLVGKHAAVACDRCHRRDLVQDPAVKALQAREPARRTYLGAPPMASCASCHADAHRGQLGPDCRRCHDEAAWKPARGFDHARTAYPLTGKHAAVACDRCHPRADAPPEAAGPLVPTVSRRVARYRPVAHAACLDCHRDPHQGRFGAECARCHSTGDWRRVTAAAAADRAFHERTRYPLAGAHQAVACVACHGPFPGEPARFKPLAFQACTDCHADAHAGQLAGPGGACDRCHGLDAFLPARFGLEEHQRTRYPLQGAHRVVACGRCHPQVPGLADRLPAATRAELLRRGRPVRTSLAAYRLSGDLGRCETCHADPHGGQLARPQGCAGCHDLESFRTVRFDHGRDSRFALTGKHATAPCGACHRPDASAGGIVRYRPLPTSCEGCHADPHVGQLAGGSPVEGRDGCARCHGTDDWRRVLFRHEPPFTDYALTGRHRAVACAKCHPSVAVAPGLAVARYRPLPRDCEGCHADFHRGAFQGFEPAALGRAEAPPSPAATARATPDLRPVPAHGGTRCDRCHVTDGWRDVAFAHERTGFPLRGAHVGVRCVACHGRDYTRALGRDCGSCHRDPHRGQLGARCSGCHDEGTWRSRFDADAHRRTNFPLSGRHAFIPCEECHGDRRDRGFARSTPACLDCHRKDWERTRATSIDHQAAGFSTRCQQCHQPWRFTGAFFPAHEACFQIGGGPHAGIRCLSCHTTLASFGATGQCSTGTASCTRCHGCNRHPQVGGFACTERKCYECHRFSTGAALRGALRRSP